MATMKDIISSPLLLILVAVGLIYIVIFSLIHLKKAYTRCLELGITKEDLHKVIKSSLVFSIVPSLSIVVGLFALISVLGIVWSWWRLSVIGSLSYESLISSSVASALKFSSTAEMLEKATGSEFGVVMILMSIGMLSGFFILIPALFGSLTLGLFSSIKAGKKVVKNGLAGVIPVLVIVAVLALIVRITSGGSLFGMIGFLILFMLPVAIISSRIMWKKGIIKVVDNDEAISEKAE